MPHNLKYAKRLLRELGLVEDPKNAAEVLRSPKYWDPVFLTLFFDLCDDRIFHDPHTGLVLAQVAPDLALLVPEGTTPEDRQCHREHLVRSFAILGGADRATGRPNDANEPTGGQ